jgi:hypothetical protein
MFLVTLCAVASLVAYFIPTFIAIYREHVNVLAITLLNLFLGWTFIGWVVALVWSVTVYQGPAPRVVVPAELPAARPVSKSASKPKSNKRRK